MCETDRKRAYKRVVKHQKKILYKIRNEKNKVIKASPAVRQEELYSDQPYASPLLFSNLSNFSGRYPPPISGDDS